MAKTGNAPSPCHSRTRHGPRQRRETAREEFFRLLCFPSIGDDEAGGAITCVACPGNRPSHPIDQMFYQYCRRSFTVRVLHCLTGRALPPPGTHLPLITSTPCPSVRGTTTGTHSTKRSRLQWTNPCSPSAFQALAPCTHSGQAPKPPAQASTGLGLTPFRAQGGKVPSLPASPLLLSRFHSSRLTPPSNPSLGLLSTP